MPVVVLTNDDGIHAPGLAALEKALAELGDVYVVAPEREQSACGHALTLHRPLRALKMGERRFAVNGTPSDCANMAVLGFLPETPVLIVSGINHGANLGDDVTYSGTVSAAMEGTILGVPSIAVSLVDGGDFEVAGRVARLIAMRVLVGGLPGNTLLNVNVPSQPPRGIRMTRLGHRSTRKRSWSRPIRGAAATTGSAAASPVGRSGRHGHGRGARRLRLADAAAPGSHESSSAGPARRLAGRPQRAVPHRDRPTARRGPRLSPRQARARRRDQRKPRRG
jgi:5'-nucleotidase